MLVEVWADVMCPWCYIGKRRLETALTLFEDRDSVKVAWRSFELRPEQPKAPGLTLGEVMVRWRGLSQNEVVKLFSWIRKLGEEEGLRLNPESVRPVNSFDAHRVTHLADRHGLRGEMTERLFRAHLTENVNVADRDVLVRLAAEVGLDQAETRTMLAGDEYATAVRAEEQARAVSAVPTVVVDRTHAVTGAVPATDYLALLRRAHANPSVFHPA